MNSNSNNNNEQITGGGRGWNLAPSLLARSVVNPIRQIVDGMTIATNPEKELIRLTIGDPSIYRNLNVAQECVDAVVAAVQSGNYNGYPSSVGSPEARQAVADYSTNAGVPVTADDVVLTSGCSQSLELVITLLANPGQNILIPRPGFPLYTTLAHSIGVETRFYDLKPEEEWMVDLQSLISQIDEDTAAVIVNSPSNPCGGVFSRQHIQEIIDVCDLYKLPIITDEVYEHVVYNDKEHHAFAAVSRTVPIFTVSSLSKRFLVPGWRLGWVIVNDRKNTISGHMRRSLVALTQRTLGPCSILQGALPAILRTTPPSLYNHTNSLIEENSAMVYELLSNMKGVMPIKPSGAMYMMVKIELECFPDFDSDIKFTERLMSEESVFCLPASCFAFPGYFRIVLSVPQDKSIEACERISEFCERHYLHTDPVVINGDDASLSQPLSKLHTLARISSSCFVLNSNNKR